MANENFYPVTLSEAPICPEAWDFQPEEGAEAQFLGTVRRLENEAPLRGIEYSAYLPMAEKLLAELCAQGLQEHPGHRLAIQHRLGFVAVSEPSILIRVRTKHSATAFDLCSWYLRQIKSTIPIWKKPIWA